MNSPFVILVVEDEESDFELLEMALRRSLPNCLVRWTRDGAEAKSYISGDARYTDRHEYPFPDLLITDLKLPQLTGLQLIGWLKASGSFRRLPAVVMSSSNQPTDIDEAYSLGANAYFVKPTRFDELVSLCRDIGAFWSQAIGPRMT